VGKAHRRWLKAVKKWQTNCWLLDWTFSIETSRDKISDSQGSGGYDVAGKAEYTPGYHLATVTGWEEAIEDATDEKVNEIACHETCHVVQGRLDVFVGQLIQSLPASARQLADSQWDEVKESTISHWTRILTRMDRRGR